MDAGELKRWVIVPTLMHLNMYSEAAANLLVGTAAHESKLGRWLKQVNGPALGIFQLEPSTIKDIYDNYLSYRRPLYLQMEELRSETLSREENAITNLAYATALARLVYRRVSEPLPEATDVQAMGEYWKTHYNTHLGKGTVQDYVDAFPHEVIVH